MANFWDVSGAVAFVALLAGATIGLARVAGGDSGHWTQHRDAHLGFTVSCPSGWIVTASGQTILVRSPDNGTLALAEAFVSAPGESPDERLQKMVMAKTTLFPNVRIDRVTPHESGGAQEVVGNAAYSSPGGKQGEVRLLCSIYQRSGMLYAVGSPKDRFTAQLPILLRVLKSLKFLPPQGGGRIKPAPNAAALGLKFVRWTDPKEHAFRVDVPRGWKITGGAFRFGVVDVRSAVQALSPQEDISVVIGDPSLTTFAEPTQIGMNLGFTEGKPYNPGGTQMIIFHYMPAIEFNRWYLQARLSKVVTDIKITKEQDIPSLSQRFTEAANQETGGAAGAHVSVGQTEFTGRGIRNRPFRAVLVSVTRHIGIPGGEAGIWNAAPMVVAYGESKHDIASAVFTRMLTSWQIDPNWSRQQSQTAGAVSKIWSDANTAISKSISDSYWNRSAAEAESSRNFSNATLGLTDVKDPDTGDAWKVASGHNYYWRDTRSGAIVGTETFDRPDIDFTPLTEF
jgi:hypothetical protein